MLVAGGYRGVCFRTEINFFLVIVGGGEALLGERQMHDSGPLGAAECVDGELESVNAAR